MKLFFTALLMFNFAGSQLAQASAPQVKTSAPGYYRFMVGDTEVTTLLDGAFPLKPVEFLTGIKPEEIAKLLAQSYQDPAVVTSVNGFLINTGTKLVMVDTGTGSLMGPNSGVGHLMENLIASGYKPEQVDEIYLTHMHSDHLGGLTSDGKMNYPNAVVRMDKRDADYWLSDAEAAKATEPHMKGNFTNAKLALAPYQSSGHFKPFDGATDLVPGVKAVPAYGHTPGHTVYIVESKGKKLWLIGDMIHVAAVQFPKPSVALKFDSDSKKAAAERLQDFAAAAKNGDMMGAAHLSFPGVGHIRAQGSGYVFTPLNYAPIGM